MGDLLSRKVLAEAIDNLPERLWDQKLSLLPWIVGAIIAILLVSRYHKGALFAAIFCGTEMAFRIGTSILNCVLTAGCVNHVLEWEDASSVHQAAAFIWSIVECTMIILFFCSLSSTMERPEASRRISQQD